MFKKTGNPGFSIVELAIVLIIIAIFVGMIMFTTQARLDASKTYTTKERMQIIMDAMDRFVEQYGYVPCPAPLNVVPTNANYGTTNNSNNPVGGNPCQTQQASCTHATTIRSHTDGGGRTYRLVKGALPFKILGLDSQIAVDGWGNRLDYLIVDVYAGREAYTRSQVLGNNIPANFDNGVLYNVQNLGGHTVTPERDIAYMLLSHGSNQHGGYRDKDGGQFPPANGSSQEQANANPTSGAIYQSTGARDFDDILVFKTRWHLPAHLNPLDCSYE